MVYEMKGARHHRIVTVIDLLGQICSVCEFFYRFILVNIPSYILAKYPEIDRICSFVMTYLLMQLVGICWGILVNSTFSIASRSSEFLPPYEVFIHILSIFSAYTGESTSEISKLLIEQQSNSKFSSIQLIFAFYVSYASVRVFIGFSQSIFMIALQSMKDFPEASKLLARGGSFTLNLAPLMFLPSIALEVFLLSSDVFCRDTISENENSFMVSKFCRYSGIFYLTSEFPVVRQVVVYSLIVMVAQLWQSCLHQFPKWSMVFRRLSTVNIFLFQFGVFVLSIGTVKCLLFPNETLPVFYHINLPQDFLLVFVTTGWTLWLFFFYPYLKVVHGETWIKRVTPATIENLAAYIRLSHMALLGTIFFIICFNEGILEAQLILTFMTILLPTFYCSMYLIALVAMKAARSLIIYGIPISMVTAYLITHYLAGFSNDENSKSSLLYGQGKVALVFFHIFGKLITIFGEDDTSHDYDDDHVDTISNPDVRQILTSLSQTNMANMVSPFDEPIKGQSSPGYISGISTPRSSVTIDKQQDNESEIVEFLFANSDQTNNNPMMKRISSSAELLLQERGQEHSTLVTLGLSKSVSSHWLVATSKQILSYYSNIARSLAFTDSLVHGIMLAFIALLAVISLLLCIFSIGSYAQNMLQLFPQSTANFCVSPDDSYWLFDHQITNVTLYRNQTNTCDNSIKYLERPKYAVCGWKTHGLSILDYALMSQLAYFDDDGKGLIQNITDTVFPNYGLRVVSPSTSYTQGPIFFEFHNPKTGLTVLSIRGTDVARFHDFLEDVKLYAEPVIFMLLSTIFPTIRLWTQETLSSVIEWLYELNSFFGLQGESEYYQPLLTRVYELIELNRNQSFGANNVVITGHSLGGGLARIVAMLSDQTSVAFSPPGLGLSYKKYSRRVGDNTFIKAKSEGMVHHQSVAVITELDWIAQIDEQVGLVQKISCDSKSSAHQNACHLMEGTICHILKHCGDESNRFTSCEFSFDLKVLIPTVSSFAWRYRWIILPIISITSITILLATIPDIL